MEGRRPGDGSPAEFHRWWEYHCPLCTCLPCAVISPLMFFGIGSFALPPPPPFAPPKPPRDILEGLPSPEPAPVSPFRGHASWGAALSQMCTSYQTRAVVDFSCGTGILFARPCSRRPVSRRPSGSRRAGPLRPLQVPSRRGRCRELGPLEWGPPSTHQIRSCKITVAHMKLSSALSPVLFGFPAQTQSIAHLL